MKFPIIKPGFFRSAETDDSVTGELSIVKFFKSLLVKFNIAFADECCPTTTSPTRYNETTDTLEYYDQVTNTWTNAAPPAWSLTGNAATNPSTNFLGTTDDVDFKLKRNSTDSGYITSTNTAFGLSSGSYTNEGGATPTRTSNTSIGNLAGSSNTGSNIVSIGNSAGNNNSGSNNTFVGVIAGQNNTRNRVTSVGYSSGNANLGFDLASFGYASGSSNTGDSVVALGNFTANSNSGSNVIAIGNGAGTNNTTSGRFIVGQNYLPTFADPTAANAALPAPSANGIYLYINQANSNAITARV